MIQGNIGHESLFQKLHTSISVHGLPLRAPDICTGAALLLLLRLLLLLLPGTLVAGQQLRLGSLGDPGASNALGCQLPHQSWVYSTHPVAANASTCSTFCCDKPFAWSQPGIYDTDNSSQSRLVV